MKIEFEGTFRTYTAAVGAKLTEAPRLRKQLRLVTSKTTQLRALVDDLESSAEFGKLVLETRSSFSGDYHGKSESVWREAVKNFFRRSGYYIDTFEGKSVHDDAALDRYREAFQRREVEISYLALMEYVHFAEDSMNFSTFEIRRFGADELDSIFQNKISEVFYPWAAVDVGQLQDYWFVCVREVLPARQIGKIKIPWDEISRVDIRYTAWPKAIEAVLKQLALFNWREVEGAEKDLETGWRGFCVPFVLRLSDHLLDSPWLSPDFSRLEKRPVIDSDTGEEVGEEPLTYISVNGKGTDEFKGFIQGVNDLMCRLRPREKDWEFLDVAVGFFIKAFFAEGLEQMLWHITTLEALLGEKGTGVIARLAGRIASILGKGEHEKTTVKKEFTELYSFRSDLVHGNRFKKEVYVGHLRNARDQARETLLWFLHYLDWVQTEISANLPAEGIPTRGEILSLIDLDEHGRNRLGWLVKILPSDFPSVRSWLGKAV